MRNGFMRVIAGGLMAAALAVLADTPGTAASATHLARAPSPGPGMTAGPGTQLWVSRYNGRGKGFDVARSVAVSPGGAMVFVTGYSAGNGSDEDYLTVAYNAVTGARLWASRYNGPGNGLDEGHSIAVSPAGKTVFVTGTSAGAASEQDYATVAYNALTGARLWVKRYNGPGNSYDDAARVAVSHGGGLVFVTGLSAGATSGFDYATVAYSAVTGAQLWASRYNGPGNGYDEAHSIAASPSGHTVFVTGYSAGASSFDYATVAYSAVTGARLWLSRYNGPANNIDVAFSVAVSPTGRTVYVTGFSAGIKTSVDYATVALRAGTGRRLWLSRYNGSGNGIDTAQSVAVSPTGRTVFVAGQSTGAASGRDYATIAYRAGTGARLWSGRYNGPGNDFDQGWSMAVSPSGRRVFVTGESVGATTGFDYATIAYSS